MMFFRMTGTRDQVSNQLDLAMAKGGANHAAQFDRVKQFLAAELTTWPASGDQIELKIGCEPGCSLSIQMGPELKGKKKK